MGFLGRLPDFYDHLGVDVGAFWQEVHRAELKLKARAPQVKQAQINCCGSKLSFSSQ